ncbi:MAG TPA: hypothetical protein VNJ31_12175 [Methyloceanibacter sp.]|nr:hypothetical protein [Methyloceanibacter sp.]
MRKGLLLASLILLAALPAQAVQRGTGTGSDDACTEMFHECLRGCGAPGSNLPCQRYCEEEVLARCRAGGAAKGVTVKPGIVKPQIKTAPSQ